MKKWYWDGDAPSWTLVGVVWGLALVAGLINAALYYNAPAHPKSAADGTLKAPLALTQEEIWILQTEIIPKWKKDKIAKAAWEKVWRAELEAHHLPPMPGVER